MRRNLHVRLRRLEQRFGTRKAGRTKWSLPEWLLPSVLAHGWRIDAETGGLVPPPPPSNQSSVTSRP